MRDAAGQECKMVVSRVLCAALLFLSLMATSACRPLNAPEHVAGIEGAENVESEHLALEPLDPETMFVSNPESKAIWERALAAEEIEQEEREQLFEDTLAFLEKAGPSRERFDLAIVIAQVVYGEQGEAEGKAYQRIVDIVSQSKDQDLVTRAQRLAGTARKLFLLDKELAVEGQTVDGEEFDWNKYRGKVVLLDFWGTWCGACIEELPNVKKNYELYHDRGFEVVGVAADTERSAVVDFLKKHELPWVTLFDPAGLEQPTAVRLGVTSTPTAFLVNGEGKVVSLDARGEELGLRLAELLGESKESPVNEGSTDAEPTANTQSPNIEIAKNSVDMKLKLIPAGEFLMGSPEADSAPSHEQPQHRVKITKPFLIGVYEVTQAEYKQVTGSNPSSAPRKSAEGVVEDTSRFAVDNVSWDAAAAFCNQLSELEGLSASYEI